MNYLSAFLIATIILGTTSSPLMGQAVGTFTDNRDGNSYRWVKIGYQIWMAENLKFKSRRGTSQYGLQYGLMYDWKTANTACPPGWHLPSDSEWLVLEQFAGMERSEHSEYWERGVSAKIGFKLKSKSGWRFHMQPGNGIDLYGFSVLPGGYYQSSTRRFLVYGSEAIFWTSSNFDSQNALMRSLSSSENGVMRGDMYKTHGAYVRCVQD